MRNENCPSVTELDCNASQLPPLNANGVRKKRTLLIAAGIVLIVWSVWMFLFAALNIGAVVPMLFGVWLLVYGIRTGSAKKDGAQPRARRLLPRVFMILFAVYLGVQCFCLALILSKFDHEIIGRDPDAIIVLGAGFYGEELSQVLRSRLDEAALLAKRYPNAVFVLSGDRMPGESASEAEMMYGYLTQKKGIPGKRLLMESQARVTRENFLRSKELLDQIFHDDEYVTAFVTSDFHIYRSLVFAEMYGLDANCAASPTSLLVLPAYIVRETAALLFELLLR